MDKKTVVIIAVSALLLYLVGSGTYKLGYEDGKNSLVEGLEYNAIYSQGYEQGYDKGFDYGFDSGYEVTHKDED